MSCNQCSQHFKIACLPYGWFATLPVTLVTLAWIFSMVGGFGCKTFKGCVNDACSHFGYTKVNFGDAAYLFDDDVVAQAGDECFDIPGYYTDGAMEAGHAMSAVGVAFGLLVFLGTIMTLFSTAPRKVFIGLASLCFAMALFSGLTGTLGLASENCTDSGIECTPDVGAGLAYVALLMWVGAGVSLLFMKQREREIPERSPPQHAEKSAVAHPVGAVVDTSHSSYDPASKLVQKESVVERDGSTTTTITTTETNPDGTKSVTRVVEKGSPPPHAKVVPASRGSRTVPPPPVVEDDEFEDFSDSDDETVVETDNKVTTRDDGTKVNTEIKTFTHRDKRMSSIKTIVLNKQLEDGSIKRKTTVIKTDVNGGKTKTSNMEVLDGVAV